ncbi:MAG: hypothetical protein NVS4B6_24570 [Mycobacterium sp.]
MVMSDQALWGGDNAPAVLEGYGPIPALSRYRSTAPPLPGAPMIAVSEVEIRIGIALADLHLA